ncbi:hypothetical protein BJV82DRAFT_577389 [Fennellomyces sp. T-0311]|nr:hypothetical protein BJV82DRAFT_577385 [Fennellomyces sp. T-0311]KAI8145152.1 hypothetical protein BJV82DRAFT_577389 [Fennellomyces sp. T-0311]
MGDYCRYCHDNGYKIETAELVAETPVTTVATAPVAPVEPVAPSTSAAPAASTTKIDSSKSQEQGTAASKHAPNIIPADEDNGPSQSSTTNKSSQKGKEAARIAEITALLVDLDEEGYTVMMVSDAPDSMFVSLNP